MTTDPMTYAIAAYLTDEQKARACAETYTPTGGVLRAPGCSCPLGIALGYTTDPEPSAGQVASALRFTPRSEAWRAAYDAAAVFISDWDDGRIADLAAALGVTR